MEKGKATAVTVEPLDNATAAQIVCRFYRLGHCRFGNMCRFIHATATAGSAGGSSCSTGSSPDEPNVVGGGGGPRVAKKDTKKETKKEAASEQPGVKSSAPVDLSRWIDAPVFVPQSRVLDEEEHKRVRSSVHDDNEGEEADDEDEEDEEEEEEEEEEEDNEQNLEDGAVGFTSTSAMSYANVVTMNNNHNGTAKVGEPSQGGDGHLCSYYELHGQCPLVDCVHVHGELCELCHKFCLDPRDKEQQRRHNADCIKQHELEMEHAFAVQRSRDKSCGICLEVVVEKRPREQRFGILPNCKHTFCLHCIRTWRKADNFANKIKRGCPTCRVPSDFVCPSFVWVESGEEKDRLIDNYKKACNATDCMHFKKGAATCPFGNKCFYRHALPSGELVDLGAPSRRRNQNRRRARDLEETIRLQEIVASLLTPSARMLEDYMISFLTEDDEESDDLDIPNLFSNQHIFPSDSSDYEDDFGRTYCPFDVTGA